MKNDIDLMTFLQAQKELEHTSDARRAYHDAYNKINYGTVSSNIKSWHNITHNWLCFLAYLLLFLVALGITLGIAFYIKDVVLMS